MKSSPQYRNILLILYFKQELKRTTNSVGFRRSNTKRTQRKRAFRGISNKLLIVVVKEASQQWLMLLRPSLEIFKVYLVTFKIETIGKMPNSLYFHQNFDVWQIKQRCKYYDLVFGLS